MKPVSLSRVNTLGVPSRAEHLVVLAGEDDVPALMDSLRRRGTGPADLTVLGGGSNVVLRRRVEGVTCLVRTRGIRLEPDGPRRMLLTAAAGERWHDLVRYSLGQGLAGLENLALIPGAVGGAPIQNIGAYGAELADRFVSLQALDTSTGRIHRFRCADCGFGYRDSYFKRPEAAPLIILEVTLRLARGGASPVMDYPDLAQELGRLGWSRPSPVQVAEAVIRVRRRKLPDPRFAGNVGSFFQNPEVARTRAAELGRRHPALTRRPAAGGRVKLSAAQLIDACGWKGRAVGLVGVWHRQPLVLVNRGGATGTDFLTVSEEIRRDVASAFGVTLELEPRVIGRD